jgi:ABC-type transporter MlaC component
MPDAFDLTELTEHLTRLAQAQGFQVEVHPSDDDDDSKGVPHIKVSVHNTCKSPPVKVHFNVRVSNLEREGVHVVDVHMADACRALSAY